MRQQQKYETTMLITIFKNMPQQNKLCPSREDRKRSAAFFSLNFCVEDIEKENLIRKERKNQ